MLIFAAQMLRGAVAGDEGAAGIRVEAAVLRAHLVEHELRAVVALQVELIPSRRALNGDSHGFVGSQSSGSPAKFVEEACSS